MFVVLGINILIYFVAPMYALYGNQHYIDTNNLTDPGVQAKSEASVALVTAIPDVTTNPETTNTPTTTTADQRT